MRRRNPPGGLPTISQWPDHLGPAWAHRWGAVHTKQEAFLQSLSPELIGGLFWLCVALFQEEQRQDRERQRQTWTERQMTWFGIYLLTGLTHLLWALYPWPLWWSPGFAKSIVAACRQPCCSGTTLFNSWWAALPNICNTEQGQQRLPLSSHSLFFSFKFHS